MPSDDPILYSTRIRLTRTVGAARCHIPRREPDHMAFARFVNRHGDDYGVQTPSRRASRTDEKPSLIAPKAGALRTTTTVSCRTSTLTRGHCARPRYAQLRATP